MAVTFKGVAVVWGVGNLSFTGVTIESYGKIQKYDFEHKSEQEVLADENGEPIGRAWYAASKTISISVIPSASSIATAKTNLASLIPAPSTQVILGDADGAGTPLESSNSGHYSVVSAKLGRTNKGMATVDMELLADVPNDTTATIS